MMHAQPGWPAFSNTFHKLAISNTTSTAQTIQNIGPGPSTGGENVSCIGGTPG